MVHSSRGRFQVARGAGRLSGLASVASENVMRQLRVCGGTTLRPASFRVSARSRSKPATGSATSAPMAPSTRRAARTRCREIPALHGLLRPVRPCRRHRSACERGFYPLHDVVAVVCLDVLKPGVAAGRPVDLDHIGTDGGTQAEVLHQARIREVSGAGCHRP